jgi:cell division transport system permease protein
MRTFFRIIRFGFQSMLRNFWLSFVTVSVFCLTLLTVNAVIVLNVLAQASVQSVEERVQVTVYFTSDATEGMVKNVQAYLLGLSQVKEVSYITAEEALELFRARHAADSVVLATLEEVDGNPLGQAIKIRAYNADDFSFIIEALNTPEYSPYIKEKNYKDYSSALEALSDFSQKVRYGFLVLAAFFGFIAMLIVFNTIRVAIYVHRDEIGIMKLVGANDWIVRGPFLFESIFYGFVSTAIMAGAMYGILTAANPYILQFFAGVEVDLIGYFQGNALLIFGGQFVGLALIGLVTTAVAMRRYLRI